MQIAFERASFAENFLGLGLMPGDGGAWLLPRIIGSSAAAELTYTCEVLDAQWALGCGLISQLVPHDQLIPAARKLAERIANNPPQALRLVKRLLRESQRARLPELLELAAAFQALMHESEDHAEAVTACLEKRKAIFVGK